MSVATGPGLVGPENVDVRGEAAEDEPPCPSHERGLVGGVDELVDLDPAAPARRIGEAGVPAVFLAGNRHLFAEVPVHDDQLRGTDELVAAADLGAPFQGGGEAAVDNADGRAEPAA